MIIKRSTKAYFFLDVNLWLTCTLLCLHDMICVFAFLFSLNRIIHIHQTTKCVGEREREKKSHMNIYDVRTLSSYDGNN